MAGVSFTVTLSDQEARDRLSELARRLDDAYGFFNNVGEYMRDESVRRNFANEAGSDGTPWASLRPATIARREKKGQTPIQILRSNSGSSQNLSSTIHYQVEGDAVRIGSSMVHAAVHQLGADQGAFGTSKRGRPLPWGRIPARPFLGVGPEDEREIIRIAEDWLDLG